MESAAAIGWLTSGAATLALAGGVVWRVQRARPASHLHYVLGALCWTLAVFLKVLAAFALAPALRGAFPSGLPIPAQALTAGLLTGVFECGAVYVFACWTPLRHAAWNDVVGFGLAFGCWEAAVLGAGAVLRGLVAALLFLLPADLARETAGAIGPWHGWEGTVLVLERLASLPVHLVTAALIVRAVQTRRSGPFWQSFLFKSGIDAIPIAALSLPLLELAYATYGVLALAWLARLDREERGLSGQEAPA